MAQKISKNLEKSYLFPNHPQLHFKIKLRPLINFFRKCKKVFFFNKKVDEVLVKPKLENGFYLQKNHFKKNHWSFCDKFWNEEFHKLLLKQWPDDSYFESIKSITKSYDTGFVYSGNSNKKRDNILNDFPVYKKAYEYLKSKEVCKAIKNVTSSKFDYVCDHILMTRAYWGSSVIPHIDSSNLKGNINIIIFINASSKKNTGNLGIWKDNEFKDLIFKPSNLKNSSIMYDMHKDFYHGFEPMDYGSFRWALAAKYKQLI